MTTTKERKRSGEGGERERERKKNAFCNDFEDSARTNMLKGERFCEIVQISSYEIAQAKAR